MRLVLTLQFSFCTVLISMALTIYLSLFFLFLYLLGLSIRRVLFLRDKARMEQESRGGGRVIARV